MTEGGSSSMTSRWLKILPEAAQRQVMAATDRRKLQKNARCRSNLSWRRQGVQIGEVSDCCVGVHCTNRRHQTIGK